MDTKYLHGLSFNSLKNIAEDMGLSIPTHKKELLDNILDCFKSYEEYKKEKLDKYKKIEQLGNTGKEGVTYLVKTNGGRYFAMKTFKKTKSSERLKQEAELQDMASKFGIAPKVIEIDTVSKYIVMEKLDKHLVDIMKQQNGDLTIEQQIQIINIFEKLDESKVFHGDSNILNYMYKKNKLYMIDFGMSKKIDDKLIKKLKTNTPNMSLMNLGFILKLKELECPPSSYSYLIKFVSEKDKQDYRLI
jgi:tRNA A-37 threonylcarbamoyl transferase component Bud32